MVLVHPGSSRECSRVTTLINYKPRYIESGQFIYQVINDGCYDGLTILCGEVNGLLVSRVFFYLVY
jgi:hypothetical protein